jgi:2'-5' RNA ligase
MDGVLIAYLPENGAWCKQDFPHMTLVYAGKLDDRQPTDLNEITKDAISAARITGPFSLPVTSVEVFDEGVDAVDVLVMYPTPQLLLARNVVKHWDESEFKNDYKPHATIGPVGSAFADSISYVDDGAGAREYREYDRSYTRESLPDRLYFNRIAVVWGDKKLVFNTNSF